MTDYKTPEGRVKRHAIEKRWRRKYPIKHLLKLAKARAKRTGIEFDLTDEDVSMPTHCPILGIKLCPSDGYRSINSPSLDRIDNKQGYVKGNVAIISWKANSMKKDLTLGILENLVRYVKKEI